MYIVTVNPLDQGVFKEELSYFSSQAPAAGALVTVPIRRRQIPALVISAKPAKQLKGSLKQAEFKLKKITAVTGQQLYQPAFLTAASQAADYFAATLGQTLKTFTPQAILDQPQDIKWPVNNLKSTANSQPNLEPPGTLIIQDIQAARLSAYKSLIRESFAKQQSVFLCLPTVADIEKTLPVIEKGIADYTYAIHSQLTKLELRRRWSAILSAKHPVLIIGTPIGLSIPRLDLALIIIDQENSESFKLPKRPFIDARYLANQLAATGQYQILLGDQVLRTETIYALGQDQLTPVGNNLKFRFISEARYRLIDLTADFNPASTDFKPNLISEQLQDIIRINQEKNDQMLIIAGRRGLIPVIFCQDCRRTVTCPHCQAPAVLHQKAGQRYLLCHKCGRLNQPEDRCPTCSGWRLIGLGGGIDRLAEELTALNLTTRWWQIDSDTTTPKQAKAKAQALAATPGGLLIGTEMALHYLKEPIATTAVVAIDGMFNRPDFRQNEKILKLLMTIRNLANKQFIIQTSNPAEPIFEYVANGNLLDFFREEISDRQTFGYPPFRVLIKISGAGPAAKIEMTMNKLADQIKDYQPIIYPGLIPIVKNQYQLNILVRLKSADWPDSKLLNWLKQLPPDLTVNIDPSEILS